jgi:hypothetical protein
MIMSEFNLNMNENNMNENNMNENNMNENNMNENNMNENNMNANLTIDIDELNTNVLLNIRENVEEQITSMKSYVTFHKSIIETMASYENNSDMKDIICDYQELHDIHCAQGNIQKYEKLVDKLNHVVFKVCKHDYEVDYVDIDPEKNVKVTYCKKCFITMRD